MKKTLISLFWISALLFGYRATAQVSAYNFTQAPGTYGAINTNTANMIGTILQDDDVNTFGLPFTFTFNGTPYTSIEVCSNGYLSFNALTGSEYTAISDMGTSEVIAPFSTDLLMATLVIGDISAGSNTITNLSSTNGFSIGDSIFDVFSDFGGFNPVITGMSGNSIVLNMPALSTNTGADIIFMNGSIRQSVSGSAPNRICEFQFRNMSRFFVYDEVINFKVRLYETTNKIEFIYGPIFPGLDQTPCEVGLKGTAANDFNSRTVTSNISWSNSLPSSSITDDCDFTSSNYPQSGLHYVWTSSVCVAPSLVAVQSSSIICSGQTSTISATGATSYSWSTGSTSPQIVVSPGVTTTYTVVGFDGNCSSTITVTQNTSPGPAINITQSQPVICVGQSGVLIATGASTYSWSNGVINSQTTITPTANTVYTVTGLQGLCSGTATITQNVAICTALEGTSGSLKDFMVYPNPSNGRVNIKVNSNSANLQLNIYNVLGAVVYSQAFENNKDLTIDTGLAEGVYLLELLSEHDKQVKQIVVTK